jgi:hypothetical protein
VEIWVSRIRVRFLNACSSSSSSTAYRRNQECQTSVNKTQAAVSGFAIKASLNQDVSVLLTNRCSVVTLWLTALELDKVDVLRLDCIAIMANIKPYAVVN